MAITVHLQVKGRPLRMLLDLVELAKVRTSRALISILCAKALSQSHSGFNLAVAFRDVLKEFAIEDKVSGVGLKHGWPAYSLGVG